MVQRFAIVIAISLAVILVTYYTPLRDYLGPKQELPSDSGSAKKPSEKDSEFNELQMELLAVSNKLSNLQGKIQILKIAQEHRDWFKDEEFSKLPELIAKAEEELKQAEQEYEKLKDKYVHETAVKILKESQTAGGKKEEKASQ
jgi:peptidoglycan hydrolase CwlO-like protein